MSDNRNIDLYQQTYDQSPFETTMVEIRKKIVLDFLVKNKAKNIIEIGCGNTPIFNDYHDFDKMIVVEPSKKFYEKSKQDALNFPGKNIISINDYFSDAVFTKEHLKDIDAILISGLLHEVPDPEIIMKSANVISNAGTNIHVNVPNANSLHRMMALELGMIDSVVQISDRQKQLQQYRTFDMNILSELSTKTGFKIVEKGSYFIKPFTHAQMHFLEKSELFGPKIIEGLDKLIKYMPDFGAEIFVNLKK